MLRYALIRLLWTVPVMLFASAILFFVLTRMPPAPSGSRNEPDWTRFRPVARVLPLFVNLHPDDASSLADRCIRRLAESTEDATSKQCLQRLGGAALPHVLKILPTLPVEQQKKIAVALLPIARRMGLWREPRHAEAPESALAFWNRFSQERVQDFQPSVVQRAVHRQIYAPSPSRLARVRQFDTYALPAIAEELVKASKLRDSERIRRSFELIAGSTGLGRLTEPAPPARLVHRSLLWRSWWIKVAYQYETLDAASQLSAALLQTRYGQWALEALSLRLGVTGEGTVWSVLIDRGRLTALLALLALVGAYVVALPSGLFAAVGRNALWTRIVSLVSLGVFVLTVPSVVASATGFAHAAWPMMSSVLIVTVGLFSSPFRHQRIAALYQYQEPEISASRGRGLPRWALLVQVAKVTSVLGFTLAPLDFPVALTATLVLERAWHLPGLSGELVQAFHHRDLHMLMAMSLALVAVGAVLNVIADVLQATTDPRLRVILLKDMA